MLSLVGCFQLRIFFSDRERRRYAHRDVRNLPEDSTPPKKSQNYGILNNNEIMYDCSCDFQAKIMLV